MGDNNWSRVRLPCMVTKSSLQSWEIHPKPLLSLHRKGQLAGCSLGVEAVFLCLQTLIRPSVTWSGNQLSLDQWILHYVLKFQPRRAKHHAKCDRRCRSANSGRLMTLLDLSPADFRRFLIVLVDRRLLVSQWCLSIGLVANGIRLTKRCKALSSRWEVFHIAGVCVFSHQSADYRTSLLYACRLFAIFVLLIFAFVPCLLRMNNFFKTTNLNTHIRSVNNLNFE
jgi:hypothetical protein